ncbi:hypothetical protein, partial [Agrobacterium tumefaciens]|uniref:hypothetical protein n=1 Tax=Agrobacterium tumefaciens TaxID=358 RepID=UPI001AE8E883
CVQISAHMTWGPLAVSCNRIKSLRMEDLSRENGSPVNHYFWLKMPPDYLLHEVCRYSFTASC